MEADEYSRLEGFRFQASAVRAGPFAEAVYDEALVQQIGPSRKAFFDFFGKEILPEFD